MMYYLESGSHDPGFNLALEQYVFDRMDRAHAYCMLWQNDNAIIVGKNQNTVGEINAAYVKEHGIRVVRRLSGGGAVYHDLGNINFTFIVDSGATAAFDFSTFCRPIVKALEHFGVHAEINGRNDMTIDGKKFSGNSQYGKQGRTMHHGTILYDSDLEVVEKALTVSRDKLEGKGIQSVRSRALILPETSPPRRFLPPCATSCSRSTLCSPTASPRGSLRRSGHFRRSAMISGAGTTGPPPHTGSARPGRWTDAESWRFFWMCRKGSCGTSLSMETILGMKIRSRWRAGCRAAPWRRRPSARP